MSHHHWSLMSHHHKTQLLKNQNPLITTTIQAAHFQGNPRLIINFGVPFCFLAYLAIFCKVNESYRAGMVKAFYRRRWEVLMALGCVATGLIIIGFPITEADPVALIISSLLMCFIWLVSVLRALRTDYGITNAWRSTNTSMIRQSPYRVARCRAQVTNASTWASSWTRNS